MLAIVPCLLAVMLAVAEPKPIAMLLPKDTALLVTSDDVPGFVASLKTLPVYALLASEDHEELAAFLTFACASIARQVAPNIDAHALAHAPIRRAFFALAPNDAGELEPIVGFEWADSEPEGLLQVPRSGDDIEPGPRKLAIDRWTIVVRSRDLDARLRAITAGKEQTLVTRDRFVAIEGKLPRAAGPELRAWLDRDLTIGGTPVGSGTTKRPNLEAPKTFGALAWSARAEAGRVASHVFIEAGAPPSVCSVVDLVPFDRDWLAFVPQDARAFTWMQLDLSQALKERVDFLEQFESVKEIAGMLREFAEVFGPRVLIVMPKGGTLAAPVVEAFVQVRQREAAAQGLDFIMQAISTSPVHDFAVSRTDRDDGRAFYAVVLDAISPWPVTVHVTMDGDWLILSTSALTLDDQLARVTGAAGSDIRSNRRFSEPFAKLMEGQVPVHGVSYVDLSAAFAGTEPTISALVSTMFSPLLQPLDSAVFDSIFAAIDAAPPTVAITRHEDAGWLTTRQGFAFGDFSLLWCAVPPAAFVAPTILAREVTRREREDK